MIRRTFLAAALLAVAAVAGTGTGYALSARAPASCCAPGAECCYPGSPCCESGCCAGAR